MVLPLRTLASSNGCKTRQSDWCAHCQDMNTSHRHLYVFTGCRLSLESISRLLCSVSSAFMDTPPVILNAWSPSRRLRHTTSARVPVSSRKIIHDHRKKTLGDRAFSNASAKIWNSLPQSLQSQQNFNAFKSLLKTHYFREAFNFFLQFYIAYIFAFYCKFKIVNRSQ